MKELFDEQKQEVTEDIEEAPVVNTTHKWWNGKKCSRCDSIERIHIMSDNGLAICEKCLTK